MNNSDKNIIINFISYFNKVTKLCSDINSISFSLENSKNNLVTTFKNDTKKTSSFYFYPTFNNTEKLKKYIAKYIKTIWLNDEEIKIINHLLSYNFEYIIGIDAENKRFKVYIYKNNEKQLSGREVNELFDNMILDCPLTNVLFPNIDIDNEYKMIGFDFTGTLNDIKIYHISDNRDIGKCYKGFIKEKLSIFSGTGRLRNDITFLENTKLHSIINLSNDFDDFSVLREEVFINSNIDAIAYEDNFLTIYLYINSGNLSKIIELL